MEEELDQLHQVMASPDVFRGEKDVIRAATDHSQSLPTEIEAAFTRWAELDERA